MSEASSSTLTGPKNTTSNFENEKIRLKIWLNSDLFASGNIIARICDPAGEWSFGPAEAVFMLMNIPGHVLGRKLFPGLCRPALVLEVIAAKRIYVFVAVKCTHP